MLKHTSLNQYPHTFTCGASCSGNLHALPFGALCSGKPFYFILHVDSHVLATLMPFLVEPHALETVMNFPVELHALETHYFVCKYWLFFIYNATKHRE